MLFVNFLLNEDGHAAVEYALVLALIVVVLVAAIFSVGNALNGNRTGN